MARDYAKFSPRFWTGETGRALRGHPDAQRLAAYLITSPTSTMTGLYYLPLPVIGHEVGMAEPDVLAAFKLLAELDFAFYDAHVELAWVPGMAAWQIDDELRPGDKRIIGIKRELSSFRWHPFVADFWKRYEVPFRLGPQPEAPSKALARPFMEPEKPLRSHDHDQDQEQEQEQSRPTGAPARSMDLVPPTAAVESQSLLTGHRLLAIFGALREEHVPGTLGWVTPRLSAGKAEDVAAQISANPDALGCIGASVAIFFGKAKAGAYGKDSGRMLKDPTFGFSCWAAKFQELVEEIRGVTPAEPVARNTGPPRNGAKHPTKSEANQAVALSWLNEKGNDP